MRIDAKYLKKINHKYSWCVVCLEQGNVIFGHKEYTWSQSEENKEIDMFDDFITVKELEERRDAINRVLLRIKRGK